MKLMKFCTTNKQWRGRVHVVDKCYRSRHIGRTFNPNKLFEGAFSSQGAGGPIALTVSVKSMLYGINHSFIQLPLCLYFIVICFT